MRWKKEPSKTNSNKTSSNSTSAHKNTTPSNSNKNNNGDGNKGGWEHSEIRIYLQTDVFNALPEELKNVITITKVISENDPNDNTKMTTSNTLYLLSLKEVVGNGMDETR